MKKSFPMNFHLLFETDLPDYSFEIKSQNKLENKKEYNVPCIFQIWIKKNIDRRMNLNFIKLNSGIK